MVAASPASSAAPKAAPMKRYCEICGKEYEGKNRNMNKVQHMVHHFKEQLYASLPAPVKGDMFPFKCPAENCQFEAKHKPDWARHFGTVHKHVDRLLALYLEQHAEAWANQPENRELMRENSPAAASVVAGPGRAQQSAGLPAVPVQHTAGVVQRSPSLASAATSNSDQLDVSEGLMCKIKELQQQQQQQQPSVVAAVTASRSQSLPGGGSGGMAVSAAPAGLTHSTAHQNLSGPYSVAHSGGMLLTTATTNRLAVELPKSDLTQFITSALNEKNVPHAVDNGNHKKIILTNEQQVLEKKVQRVISEQQQILNSQKAQAKQLPHQHQPQPQGLLTTVTAAAAAAAGASLPSRTQQATHVTGGQLVQQNHIMVTANNVASTVAGMTHRIVGGPVTSAASTSGPLVNSVTGGGIRMTAASPGPEKQEFRTVHIQLPTHMLKQAGQGTVQVQIPSGHRIQLQQMQQESRTGAPHHHQYLKIQTPQGEQLVRVQTSAPPPHQLQRSNSNNQTGQGLLQVVSSQQLAAPPPPQQPSATKMLATTTTAASAARPTAQQTALHQRIAQAVTSGGGSAIVVESQGMQNTPLQQQALSSAGGGHHVLAKMVGGGGSGDSPPQHIIQSKIVQHQGRTYLVQFRAQKPIEPGKQIVIRTNQTGIGGTALVQEVMDEVIRQQYQKQTDQEKINELALQLQQQSQQHLEQAHAVQKQQQQQQSSAAGPAAPSGGVAAVAPSPVVPPPPPLNSNPVTKLTLQQQQLLLPTEPHPQIAAQHQKNQQQLLHHHQQQQGQQHQVQQHQRVATTSILQQQLEKGMNNSTSVKPKVNNTPVQCMLCIEMPWFPNQEHLDNHYSTAHGIMKSTDPVETGDLDFSNADLEASLSSMTDLKDDAGDFETLLDALPPSPDPNEMDQQMAPSPGAVLQRHTAAPPPSSADAAAPSSSIAASSSGGQQQQQQQQQGGQGVTRLCELCGFEPRTKNKSRERMDHLAMKHFRDQMISELRKDKPMKCPRCDQFESKDRQQLFRHMISKHKVLDFYLAAAVERMKAEGKQPFCSSTHVQSSSSGSSEAPDVAVSVLDSAAAAVSSTAPGSGSLEPPLASVPQQYLLPSLNTMVAKELVNSTSSIRNSTCLDLSGGGGGALVDPIPQVAVSSYSSNQVTLAEFMESDLLQSHHIPGLKAEEEDEEDRIMQVDGVDTEGEESDSSETLSLDGWQMDGANDGGGSDSESTGLGSEFSSQEDTNNPARAERYYKGVCPVCHEEMKHSRIYHFAASHFRPRLNQELTSTRRPFACPDCGEEHKHKMNLMSHYLGKHQRFEAWLRECLDSDPRPEWMDPNPPNLRGRGLAGGRPSGGSSLSTTSCSSNNASPLRNVGGGSTESGNPGGEAGKEPPAETTARAQVDNSSKSAEGGAAEIKAAMQPSPMKHEWFCELCHGGVTQRKEAHYATVHFKDRLRRILPNVAPFICIICKMEHKHFLNLSTHYLTQHGFLREWLKAQGIELTMRRRRGDDYASTAATTSSSTMEAAPGTDSPCEDVPATDATSEAAPSTHATSVSEMGTGNGKHALSSGESDYEDVEGEEAGARYTEMLLEQVSEKSILEVALELPPTEAATTTGATPEVLPTAAQATVKIEAPSEGSIKEEKRMPIRKRLKRTTRLDIREIMQSVLHDDENEEGEDGGMGSDLMGWMNSQKGSRDPPPVRAMTSSVLTKPPPHRWLCDGKLLLLSDSIHADNLGLFQEQWRRGQPVVVANVSNKLDISLWHPNAFSAEFGHLKHDIINCKTHKLIPQVPLKWFWDGFESLRSRLLDKQGMPMLLKLKDWPPEDDFAQYFPRRFADLMKWIPLPDYTRREGRFNLASYMPDFFVCPDLGPKMYIAYGSSLYPEYGSTNLHLDMSDAVNLIVYVGIPEDGNREEHYQAGIRAVDEAGCDLATRQRVREDGVVVGALWHIFHPRDADRIRDFLNKVALEKGQKLEPHNDPIHDQSIYLDGRLRQRLFEEYGVIGYAYPQCEGDTIFIPAGAPHQVRNIHNCIKVAEDFVSPENLEWCFYQTEEFRHLTDSHTNHEDKLQIKNILYHAVKECVAFLENYEMTHGEPK